MSYTVIEISVNASSKNGNPVYRNNVLSWVNIILWRACNLTSFSPCLTGPVDYRLASCHEGPGFKTRGGYLCETRILLLALSRYIGDPDVIWSLALSPLRCFTRLRADNLWADLITQLFCPGFTLAAGPPSSFTTDRVGCWGKPCGEPAISLHSHHVSLVQWTTRLLPVIREPGSKPRGGYLCETGNLLLALSRYNVIDIYQRWAPVISSVGHFRWSAM